MLEEAQCGFSLLCQLMAKVGEGWRGACWFAFRESQLSPRKAQSQRKAIFSRLAAF